MATVAMSGSDTVNINNRVITDFAGETPAELDFGDEIATVQVGKDGNAIYGLNEKGRAAGFKLRLVRGSADDKYMNNLMTQQQANFAGFVLMPGEFIKKVGDGKGNITSDTYIASGGIFVKLVPGKMNVSGEADQSIAEYSLKFAKAARALT